MALERYDRIAETTTTTGTGTYNLAGAKTGFKALVDRVTTGATVEYCVTDGTDWEVGIGTFTDATPDTLARTTVLASSNADAAVNWGAGSKDVFLTLPASRMVPGLAGEVMYSSAEGIIDGASALHWDNGNSRLGVNQSSPAVTLDINGVTRHRDSIRFGASGLTGIITWGSAALQIATFGNNSFTKISFGTNTSTTSGVNTHRLVIDGSGLIGINAGTDTPGAQLELRTSGTGVIGQIIKGTAGQTANLFEAQDSSGNVGAVITEDREFSNQGDGSGPNNEIFGIDAGIAFTSAEEITLFGKGAGKKITSAHNSVFIGWRSGDNVTTGTFNTFVGAVTGNNFDTGSHCTALGYGILMNDEGGNSNPVGAIAIGSGSRCNGDNIFVAGGSSYPTNNVHFGKGVINATPTNYTLHGTGGSGTDIAGGDITIAGGKGTGTGVGGDIVFQTATAGSTGSSLNALATAVTIDGNNGDLIVGAVTGGEIMLHPGSQSDPGIITVGGNASTRYRALILETDQNEIIIGNSRLGNDIIPGCNTKDLVVSSESGGNLLFDGFVGVGINESSPGAMLHAQTAGTGVVGEIIKGTAGQTANLEEWQDSSANIGARINAALDFSNPSQSSGANNEIFGAGAGAALTTGTNNTLIGTSTAGSITIGTHNCIIGTVEPLFTNASYNTIIGSQAGLHITSATEGNVFMGYKAGDGLSSGKWNICIGYTTGGASGVQDSISMGRDATFTAGAQFVAGGTLAPMTDVHFGKGVINATPTNYTLHGTGGSGTDVAGADIRIAGGKGTGTGLGGDVVFQTATVGSTGSSLNALVDVLTIGDSSLALGNTAEGGTGRITRKSSHETHTLSLAASSVTTTISIPSGSRLLAVQMNVNTAVTDDAGDGSWTAEFITGSTTSIAWGAAAAQNTKVDVMLPDEITSGIAEITFQSSMGGSFTAGVIEIICYYEQLTSMANA